MSRQNSGRSPGSRKLCHIPGLGHGSAIPVNTFPDRRALGKSHDGDRAIVFGTILTAVHLVGATFNLLVANVDIALAGSKVPHATGLPAAKEGLLPAAVGR